MVIGCREMDLWENILPQCLALRQVKMAQISCAKRFSVLRQTIFQSAENGFQVCRHPFYGLCRDG